MFLKEEPDYNYFSLDSTGTITQSGVPFEHKIFRLKSSFKPVGPFQLESMFYSMEQDLHRQKYRKPKKKNLTKESKAIRSLNKNKNIVILDKQSCINEGQRQLHDTQFYEETDTDLTGEVMHRINLHVNNMLQKGQISKSTCNYHTADIDRTQQFYLLPKIHKDPYNLPGRPIVSGFGGSTEKISQFVDHFIGSLVPLSQSYIRDSAHLINIFNRFTMQPSMLLCTLDIASLYTNISQNEGIQ